MEMRFIIEKGQENTYFLKQSLSLSNHADKRAAK